MHINIEEITGGSLDDKQIDNKDFTNKITQLNIKLLN